MAEEESSIVDWTNLPAGISRAPLWDGPAYRAGVRSGDLLLEVTCWEEAYGKPLAAPETVALTSTEAPRDTPPARTRSASSVRTKRGRPQRQSGTVPSWATRAENGGGGW